jgi:hypothetical protein
LGREAVEVKVAAGNCSLAGPATRDRSRSAFWGWRGGGFRGARRGLGGGLPSCSYRAFRFPGIRVGLTLGYRLWLRQGFRCRRAAELFVALVADLIKLLFGGFDNPTILTSRCSRTVAVSSWEGSVAVSTSRFCSAVGARGSRVLSFRVPQQLHRAWRVHFAGLENPWQLGSCLAIAGFLSIGFDISLVLKRRKGRTRARKEMMWSSHSVPGGKHVSRADQYP